MDFLIRLHSSHNFIQLSTPQYPHASSALTTLVWNECKCLWSISDIKYRDIEPLIDLHYISRGKKRH